MKPTTAAARKTRSKAATANADPEAPVGHADRSERIAVSAYYKAQARGFAPGRELDDWLQAEAELAAAFKM